LEDDRYGVRSASLRRHASYTPDWILRVDTGNGVERRCQEWVVRHADSAWCA
jgi:hypothetical protein